VDEWRRALIVEAIEVPEIDDATDKRIREALQETIADARPESPSLALQVARKLLEEPIMHFNGNSHTKIPGLYGQNAKAANLAGLRQLMQATLATFRRFVPSYSRLSVPSGDSTLSDRTRKTNKPRTKPNKVARKTVEELEHASGRTLTTQLQGKNRLSAYDHVYDTPLTHTLSGRNPHHTYDPDSRLGALWLLTKLPLLSKKTGRFTFQKLKAEEDETTAFAKEKRYVNQPQHHRHTTNACFPK
jgi:hypothetical protein